MDSQSTIFQKLALLEAQALESPQLECYVARERLPDGREVRRFKYSDFEHTTRALRSLLTGDRKLQEMFPGIRKLTVREVLRSDDLTIALPKVISDIMVEPVEPVLVALQYLTKTIPVNSYYYELTQIGALRAQEIGGDQEYPIQYLSADRKAASVQIRKWGVRVAISEQLINDSEWDLIGIHVRAAGAALNRAKEEEYWKLAEDVAHVVFDNDDAAAAHTSGLGPDFQTPNYSITIDDFVTLFATLIRNGFNCTDVVSHAFFWEVLARDPELRWVWMQGGKAAPPLGDEAAAAFPFAFQVHLTPFTNPDAGDTSPAKIHIYAIDSSDPVLILQKDPPSTEEWSDPARDIVNFKARERWGMGIGNGGRSMAVAKNVQVVKNYGPPQTVVISS
jgi:hypothetical protein